MFIAKIFFEIRFLIIESGGRYLTIRLDLRQVFSGVVRVGDFRAESLILFEIGFEKRAKKVRWDAPDFLSLSRG